MKAIISIGVAALILAGFVLWGAGHRSKFKTFDDEYVSGGDLRSPLQGIFPHLNENHYLTLDEKTYTHVRGCKPFYLEVPQLHSILFVTGEVDERPTFHLFDLLSTEALTFRGGPVSAGCDIGAPRKPGEPFTEYIVHATSNEIAIAKRYNPGMDTILLKLNSRTVEIK